MKEQPGINDPLRTVTDDAARARHDKARKFNGADAHWPALPFIDMSDWDSTPLPPRPWAVRDRIPIGQPTLFSGEGDAGKTTVELHLCVAHVLGREWLGSLPELGPAIYLGAEDGKGELRRRLTAIADHYGVKFADLIEGGLHLISLAGEDALLGVPDRLGKIIATPLFDRLLKAATNIKPRHIGLDTSADLFGGNEVDRSQVRQFIGMLRKLAMAADGAVVLLSHPSLQGISSGTGLSGSTSWHNSVRARMYLKSAATEEGEPTDLRKLEFKKNNYGPRAESVVLSFRDGLFLPVGGTSTLEKLAEEQRIEELFLDLLARFRHQGRDVSDKRNANAYAPTAFAADPEAKSRNIRKDGFAAAMNRLFSAGKIHNETYGPKSRGWSRLART